MKDTEKKWIENSGQIYEENTGKTIALIPYFDKSDARMANNAKLMAAAPDLLNCLEELTEYCTHIPKETFTGKGKSKFSELLLNAGHIIYESKNTED